MEQRSPGSEIGVTDQAVVGGRGTTIDIKNITKSDATSHSDHQVYQDEGVAISLGKGPGVSTEAHYTIRRIPRYWSETFC